jgi:hypothetical protein
MNFEMTDSIIRYMKFWDTLNEYNRRRRLTKKYQLKRLHVKNAKFTKVESKKFTYKSEVKTANATKKSEINKNTNNNNDTGDNKDKKYKCTQCSKCYHSEGWLTRHVMNKHEVSVRLADPVRLNNGFIAQQQIIVEQGLPMNIPTQDEVEEDIQDLSGTGPGTDYDTSNNADIKDVSGPGSETDYDLAKTNNYEDVSGSGPGTDYNSDLDYYLSDEDLVNNSDQSDSDGVENMEVDAQNLKESDFSDNDVAEVIFGPAEPEPEQQDQAQQFLKNGNRSLLQKTFK